MHIQKKELPRAVTFINPTSKNKTGKKLLKSRRFVCAQQLLSIIKK